MAFHHKEKLLLLPLIIFICSFQVVQLTEVDACDFGIKPDVEISGCQQQPCSFLNGESTNLTMKFRASTYLENIYPKAIAHLGFLDIPYPALGQDDACEGITNTPCPIAKGEYVEYTYSFFMANFPTISLGLTFSLADRDINGANNDFACFFAAIQVVNP